MKRYFQQRKKLSNFSYKKQWLTKCIIVNPTFSKRKKKKVNEANQSLDSAKKS